ncbi:MAG: DUF72 domain-containing protein [Candidatus Hodarchaeota archaeon]
MTELLFGCSGWSYNEWVGPFYKDSKKSKISAYSEVFKTTEINTTFYSYPKAGLVQGWLRYSPKEFVFSAKIPGQITHDKELEVEKDLEDDLDHFFALMDPLSRVGKLGCFLIQLPPRLRFVPSDVEDFYALLPDKYKFAVEFRNKTWLNDRSIELLSKYNIAYTIIDEPLLPPDIYITADFTYFRWHGHGKDPWYNYLYTEDELKEWIPKIRETYESVREVYGYFNNHFHGYAPENCLDILEMLGVATPFQRQTRERIKDYRRRPSKPSLTPKTLMDFIGESPELEGKMRKLEENTESLLRLFADEGRILRGRVIRDTELKNLKAGKSRVSAKIRDYNIVIDHDDKVIQHDCNDWQRRKSQKKFCKHIVKLLLTLPERESRNMLRNISKNLTDWRFE